MEKKLVRKSELKEWANNPVTKIVQEAIVRKLEEVFDERARYMLPGDAHATQEFRMKCLGKEEALTDLMELTLCEEGAVQDYLIDQNIEVVDDE